MILFYSDELTPRIEYIGKLIFSNILQTEIAFTQNSNEFRKSELPKINYSNEKFDDEFYIKPHKLIFQDALIKPTFNTVWYEGQKYFCESSKDSDLPFDPFAASFYLLSRFEEYVDKTRDSLGRYPCQSSILTKYDLLQKPVVNIWAKLLADLLKANYPEFNYTESKFNFISTIDIDNAYAYQNKGLLRTTAARIMAMAKGNRQDNIKRKRVLSGEETDPYDTYEYLDSVFSGNEDKVKFFFLLGDYGRYDKNIAHTNKTYQDLIKETAGKYDVGIHPSYASSKKGGKKKVILEKQRLEKITGKSTSISRQHYLRLRLPKTYRRLIKAGITEDYTMGYSAQPGFRAGICTPYYFYDLKNENVTNLKIIPFSIMDGTLRYYLQLPPEKAFEEIKKIMQEVKDVGGTFVSIWHNETVNDIGTWKGYREVFEKMNKLGFEWANE